MKQPMIPRSKTNPIGQTDKIKAASSAIRADITSLQKWLVAEVASWPYTLQNGRVLNRSFYEYNIDLARLRMIVDYIISQMSQGKGAMTLNAQTSAAYRAGIAAAVANLAGISDTYPRTVLQRLGDDFVTRRAALAGARAFEYMKGFAGDTGADLGRVLFAAVQSGQNPRDLARDLSKRFAVSRTRALRIARTEVTTALRRGRWDEAKDAEEKFGNEVRVIHYSALIPDRTRPSHAARHGTIHTVDDEAEWYAKNGNSVNCLCSQTEVMFKNGKPLISKKLLDKLDAQRAGFHRV